MIKNDDRWKQFCEIHSRELVPFLNAFEVKRRRTAPWVMLCDIISYLLFFFFLSIILISCFTHIDFVNKYDNLCISAVIIFSILNLIARSQKKKFKSILKNNCMEKVLKVFGNINYKNCTDISNLVISDSIKDDVLRNSMLFVGYNKRHDDDLFYGNYDDVDFQILETRLLYESNSSKKKSTTLVFKGLISFFTSNKNFSGQTIIATRGDSLGTPVSIWLVLLFMSPFLAIGGALIYFEPTVLEHWVLFIVSIFILLVVLASYKNKPKLEEIKLEDPEIRKHFVVYSTDQVEARYLLTPSFIQRFKRLKTAYGTKKIKCSFFDNKVMFAIRSKKDLFELGHLYKSLHDPQAIYTLYNEIASIQAMIKHFKFDEKTGI